MPDPTVPASSSTPNGPSRAERGLATPGRRHVIVGGTAMLAALGLNPQAEATMATASLPDAVNGASNSRLQRWKVCVQLVNSDLMDSCDPCAAY